MTLGITGHQRLPDPGMWDWVESVMDGEIGKLSPPLIGVTSLAIGADQLFARIVLQHGGSLLHIKPFADYERTFDASGLAAYRELAAGADTEILSVSGDDEDAFLAAGKRVVECCERLFAVWNGQPARGKGGTADIVRFAAESGRSVVLVNPITRQVATR